MSDLTRITGLAAPFDTEAMIEKLMKAERVKVDKVEQQKDYTEWKRDTYRDMINLVRGFKDEYFDFLNSENNMRSPGTFNVYEASATVGGVTTNAVEVRATSDAAGISHKITEISQLATKDTWESGTSITKAIDGSGLDISKINNGDKFDILSGGERKAITLDGGYTTIDQLVTDISGKMTVAGITGSVTKTSDGNNISFSSADPTFELVKNSDDTSNTLTNIGFISGADNVLTKSETLNEVFGGTGDYGIKINGKELNFTEDATIDDVINTINSKDMGARLSHSELTGKFTLLSDKEGVSNAITIEDISGKNSLKTSLGLSQTAEQEAKDAKLTIDGVTVTKGSNNFTIDGMEYTLKATSTDTIDIKTNTNATDLSDKIIKFVGKYNEIVETVNDKLTEKRYYDYKPLTDEEKKAMEEKDIELWEERAKSGILKGDTNLDTMLVKMRRALYETVKNSGINLKDMGITTSPDYKKRGQLIVDKEKLENALENDTDKVVKLFTSDGDTYESKGISNRLYDIIEENIRTTGGKGILLKKAGMEGDRTENDNFLDDRIDEYDDRIDELIEDLNNKEDYYYSMFARMEQAMSKMQSQSSWLMSQMGGM